MIGAVLLLLVDFDREAGKFVELLVLMIRGLEAVDREFGVVLRRLLPLPDGEEEAELRRLPLPDEKSAGLL